MVGKIKSFAIRRAARHFADKHHFVYFSDITQQDDQPIVLGVTAANTHKDSFYVVGNSDGYDFMMLHRENTVVFPGKPNASYKWLILQIDLKKQNLPHVFVDNQHRGNTFFANLAVGFSRLRDMSGLFEDIDAKVLVDSLKFEQARMLFSPVIVSGLLQNFKHLDIEVIDDRLFVYAKDANVSLASLEHTLKLGTWLAAQFDSIKLPEA